ncbi:MAG: hypothetical protein KGK01_02865 [Bradyrhizobium sp.]|uniref:hypothetical protein n=1 Tax=Bradyrhizobium sp. TaxID=376 RepID=UPI001C2842A3|nr:hypothetical protein [Bradyrhizobium sp.]MBU6461648.1 hypothetical protein [Pseudomonadota bacterium]MDE2067554.1 hypothetical protein [Bradyrhizobium sp.]MDE2241403.1 hypothetical protein [Bradyrhizobium sp.]MDE2467721.1 hypothetical protein [Bradyrhizobium sp.]
MRDKPDDASRTARANRLRLAAEEGARAGDAVAKEAIAVRKNMARLRELRLAKEADTIRQQIAAGNDPKAMHKKRLK